MTKLVISEPNERQKLFLSDRHKFIAFGGARGGGKSWAVRVKAVLLCLNYSGIRVCIVRRTYPELYTNHIQQLRSMTADIAKYNSKHNELRFINGSYIFFRFCQNVSDLDKFQGQEYDVLFIDEATQFTEEMYNIITACVRGVNSFPKRIYLTCNPGGRGHGWVKRLFIDRAYKSGEKAEDYNFIKSRVTDNTALMRDDPSYIERLQALPPKLRRAWLEGDWDIFEGQFFEEFRNIIEHYDDMRYTHVIEPFEIPLSWNIYRSYDFGFAKPFSCGWWAVSHDNVAYRILELYGCRRDHGMSIANEGIKWNPDQQFEEIAKMEREHPMLRGRQIFGVADPSIWDTSRGDAIAEAAERHGVYFSPGDNNRIPGWMQCHYRMAFDEDGYPMMYVFNTCKDFIRTIPLLCYSETRPEDLDTAMEDHIADEMRYFFMSRPIAPRRLQAKPVFTVYSDPLNTAEKAKKKSKNYFEKI